MKEKDIYAELSSIRSIMERSSKFISLSGLSGIMAGIYALIGSGLAYRICFANSDSEVMANNVIDPSIWQTIFVIALIVLILSLITGIWLTIRQATKKGERYWNPVSKRLLTNLAIPLITGGVFILILIFKGNYELVVPVSMLFYGLALVVGSQYTFTDVKWLGLCEIFLGLLAAMFPQFGIIIWGIGFGILHILYGSIMHFKYNQ